MTKPEIVLTATYFDTPSHSLSAAGATLRRRTGGDDDGWHLKLKVADGERLEVHRPLGRSQSPPARSPRWSGRWWGRRTSPPSPG